MRTSRRLARNVTPRQRVLLDGRAVRTVATVVEVGGPRPHVALGYTDGTASVHDLDERVEVIGKGERTR